MLYQCSSSKLCLPHLNLPIQKKTWVLNRTFLLKSCFKFSRDFSCCEPPKSCLESCFFQVQNTGVFKSCLFQKKNTKLKHFVYLISSCDTFAIKRFHVSSYFRSIPRTDILTLFQVLTLVDNVGTISVLHHQLCRCRWCTVFQVSTLGRQCGTICRCN